MIEKQKENGPIILNRPEGQVQLSNKQVVEIIKQQQGEIEKMRKEKAEMDRLAELMKHKLVELHNKTVSLRKEKEALEEEKKALETQLTPSNTTGPDDSSSAKKVSFVDPIEVHEAPMNKSDPVVIA